MRYCVHLYVVVRVPIQIAAASPLDAIAVVEQGTDFGVAFRQGEFADDIQTALVDQLDEHGDVLASQFYRPTPLGWQQEQ